MYICNCLGLTESQIRASANKDTTLLEFLGEIGAFDKNNNINNACGKCFREIVDIIFEEGLKKNE